MAKNSDSKPASSGITDATESDGPIGAATGEYAAEDTPAPMHTCDFPAEGQTASPATCEFTALPAPGMGTVDLEAPASVPRLGSPHPGHAINATCDFPSPAPGTSPGTCDFSPAAPAGFGTVDFQSPTEALADGKPRADNPGSATCDFDADAHRPATSLRSAGNKTQPAAPDATAKAPVPARAGRFVFKKFHAKGGMGEVWLAEDSDIGRPVALKRILKGRENCAPQFLKEARVTGQLEHPGVIPVHELSLDSNNQPYYVMKFVHGRTLREVIDAYHERKDSSESREVQWVRLLNAFVTLCQTIAYAHSRGVIHRDIKPDNVMVGAYGEVLVLDWGLAKVIGEPESSEPHAAIQLSEEDTMASMAGSIKGTPTYFAPEVAAGKVDEVDQLSDVYLLGGTLYCMITARQPREGKKIKEILELARNTPPTPPRQLDPTVPKPLDAICRKAMAHQKADRYSSAAALAEDMQRYLAGEPVSAYRETLTERAWRWVKKHRTALGRAAALVIIAAVALTAFGLVREAETDRAKAQAQANQLKREEDARQEIKNFHNRTEEARFYAASANPVAEAIPGLDASQADAKAEEALKIAGNWGPDLGDMPLEDQRPALKKDLYELLLEMAQLKSRQDEKETQSLLARAAVYQTPTRSYYRLLALCASAAGDKAQVDANQAKAADPATPASAMDYYLLGEQSRVDSLRQGKDNVNEGKQAGIKSLLARREALLDAIAFYRKALREDPNHYWSHFQLGACYVGLGSFAEAAEAFGACIALRPTAAWGYSSRGLALANIDSRRAEAQADLDQALKLNPGFRPVRLHLAAFYATQQKYKEAEAAFAEILPPADPKPMPQAYLARGQMYMNRSLFNEASADFEKVAADAHPIRVVYLHLTRCYLVEGQEQKALESLAAFLKADTADATPVQIHERSARELRLLATEFPAEAKNRREGVYRLALAELNLAVKEGGNSSSLYDELGSVQEKLAELQPKQAARWLKLALAAYGRGIEAAPKDHTILIKRGWAYVNLSDNEKARADFARAAELAPTNAESQTGLGYTEAMLKSPGPARVHANLATLYGGGDYLVLHNIACIFGALVQTDAPRAREYEDMALAQLTRAIELWKRGGMHGPNELQLIEVEPAFPSSLRAHPQFKKLLQKEP